MSELQQKGKKEEPSTEQQKGCDDLWHEFENRGGERADDEKHAAAAQRHRCVPVSILKDINGQ